jgi:hypothetical protein
MKTIHFKNGSSKQISLEAANLLRDSILNGSPPFIAFSDQNGNALFMVNVSEIVYID